MKLMFLGIILVEFFAACAAPRTTVKADDQAGTVVFQVKPSFATVEADGKEVGKARDYDGKNAVLKLDPGAHLILLKADGYKSHEVKVYLSDSQEIIEVQMEGN